ncbi:MAG: hypothetical protein OHK0036_00180 [Bacteroidia bacterium]
MNKKLPIGILSKIIDGNYYYVDKTSYVYQLANQGGGYYASVLYALMMGTGLNIVVEYNTNKGRVDMVIKYNNRAYIMEFKVIKDEKENRLNQKNILKNINQLLMKYI